MPRRRAAGHLPSRCRDQQVLALPVEGVAVPDELKPAPVPEVVPDMAEPEVLEPAVPEPIVVEPEVPESAVPEPERPEPVEAVPPGHFVLLPERPEPAVPLDPVLGETVEPEPAPDPLDPDPRVEEPELPEPIVLLLAPEPAVVPPLVPPLAPDEPAAKLALARARAVTETVAKRSFLMNRPSWCCLARPDNRPEQSSSESPSAAQMFRGCAEVMLAGTRANRRERQQSAPSLS